jgi:hypothetical protein
MTNELQKGLEGVLVGESSLSYIDGDEGRTWLAAPVSRRSPICSGTGICRTRRN